MKKLHQLKHGTDGNNGSFTDESSEDSSNLSKTLSDMKSFIDKKKVRVVV